MKDKASKKDKREKRISPDVWEEDKRLKRIVGQIEGIRNMLEDGRRLDDVLTQCKAVHSALRSIESRLLERYLDAAIEDIAHAEKRREREDKIAELMDLYSKVD